MPELVVEVPELSSGQAAYMDYIGPDLDLGFRVGKFSRPGIMALSLDVLEVVLSGANADKAAIYLLGKEPLKGVMFGRHYPIVWLRDAATPFDFLPTSGVPASSSDMTNMSASRAALINASDVVPSNICQSQGTSSDFRCASVRAHSFPRSVSAASKASAMKCAPPNMSNAT